MKFEIQLNWLTQENVFQTYNKIFKVENFKRYLDYIISQYQIASVNKNWVKDIIKDDPIVNTFG